ncbi:MAG: phage tail assembly protein T [Myxococcota bacterium]
MVESGVTAPELDAIVALYHAEPRGDRRSDIRTAHQTQLLGNLILGAAGSKKKLRMEDLLLTFRGDEPDDQAIEVLFDALQGSAAAPEG